VLLERYDEKEFWNSKQGEVISNYMRRRLREVPAKRIAMIIVATKMNFSAPRLVWCPDENPSPPPKAPPRPASDCCRRTPPMRRIDNTIWMYGIL